MTVIHALISGGVSLNSMSMLQEEPFDVPLDEQYAEDRTQQDFIEAAEARNLIVLAAHQVVRRIGWIFKTESVIMPAFLDVIAGAGWLRGCLPVLNRIGHSVPPLYFAEPLRRAPRKTWPLIAMSLVMAVPFLALSVILFFLDDPRHAWLAGVFLVLYFAFFSATGMAVLAFNTLQGKLIRPHHRGRLLGLAGTVGAVLAIACAWWLLGQWLALPNGGFAYIFGFTGVGFVLSSLLCLLIKEPADTPQRDQGRGSRVQRQSSSLDRAPTEGWSPGPLEPFRTAFHTVRSDADFRRLVTVAMLFVTAQLLFPHYQALAREQAGSQLQDLMTWVIVQNAGTGLFSLIVGPLADRFGYRLVVRFCVFTAAMTPLVALGLAHGVFPSGTKLFWLSFFLLGLTPVTFRTFSNFALELSQPADHPRYISTLKVCMAIPFLLSPLIGLLVDVAGFEAVFVGIAGLIAVGGLMTFRLSEPRGM